MSTLKENRIPIFFSFRENAVPKSLAHFGQGEDRIWIDDVTCQGTEKDFFDCYKTMEYHNCYHFEDAGVICSQGTCTTYNHLCLIYLYFLNLFLINE